MSYEGYEMYVCSQGHRWSYDVYARPLEDNRCPHRKETPAWSCSIDQTNREETEPTLEVAEAAPTCKSCGQTTGPVRYVIPGPDVRAVFTTEG